MSTKNKYKITIKNWTELLLRVDSNILTKQRHGNNLQELTLLFCLVWFANVVKFSLNITIFFPGLISLATGGPSANVVGLPMGPGVRMDPYFMDDQPIRKNLTLLTGQTAYLECNVRNLGANKVILIFFGMFYVFEI